MFCLGGSGAGQNYNLTFKLEGGAFKLYWGGPVGAGLARPGPARPGSAWLGSARTGPAQPGPARQGQGPGSGPPRLGPAWPGQAWLGLDSSRNNFLSYFKLDTLPSFVFLE